MARSQGAEVIDFNSEHPVKAIQRLTGKIGVDRAIGAVGVDAVTAHAGPEQKDSKKLKEHFEQEVYQVAPATNPDGDNWLPGDAPSQAPAWAVDALAKAGTLELLVYILKQWSGSRLAKP